MAKNPPHSKGVERASAHAEEFPLRKTAGHLIRRAHQLATAVFVQEVDGILSPHQFATLLSLCQEPGLNQVDLIARIAADRSAVSSLVMRLEAKGLLEKRRPKADARKTELFITEAGIAAVAKALAGSVRAHDRILSMMPEHLRQPFMEALQHLALAAAEIKNGGAAD